MKLINYAIISICLILFSCGQDSNNESDIEIDKSAVSSKELSYNKILQLEKRLNSKYHYSFEKKDLTPLHCNESFIEDAITYLKKTNNYLKENSKETKNNHSLKEKYNTLLEDLNSIINEMDETCLSEAELPRTPQIYSSNLRFRASSKNATNHLISSLLEVNEYRDSLNKILESINLGTTPDMQEIQKIHLYQQVLFSKEKPISDLDVKDFLINFDNIINDLPSNLHSISMGDFKISYEDIIEKNLNKSIEYNRAFFSVPSKILRGITQCLGGTKTHLLLNLRARGAHEYYQYNPVVILQSGHILPGFLVGYGDEWHLFGTETIYAGKGEVYFGNIKDIAALKEKILVLDAYDYLYINSIQFYLDEPGLVIEKIFTNFANQYHIDHFEQHYKSITDVTTNASNQNLNVDIFAFGQSTQNSGTFARKFRDQKSLSEKAYISPKEILTQIKQKISQKLLIKKIDRLKNELKNFQAYKDLEEQDSSGNTAFNPAQKINGIKLGTYGCHFITGLHQFFTLKISQHYAKIQGDHNIQPIMLNLEGSVFKGFDEQNNKLQLQINSDRETEGEFSFQLILENNNMQLQGDRLRPFQDTQDGICQIMTW